MSEAGSHHDENEEYEPSIAELERLHDELDAELAAIETELESVAGAELDSPNPTTN